MLKTIKKRDGSVVAFDPDKLNHWASWAGELGVDWGIIALGACRKVYDGCTTQELHQAMISECVDQETEGYLRMAGRLYVGDLYKQVFGEWETKPTLLEMYTKMVGLGLWAEMDYSKEELEFIGHFIDHNKDLQATLTESKQIVEKYACVDRVDKKVHETPQFVYARMALGNMESMPKDRRLHDVLMLYKYLSEKAINAPTPFSINLGTPKKQYASCCVSTTLDTAASLAAADHIAYMMTCASAGIGAHIKSRSRGDKVRSGAVVHQGKIPYYKAQQAMVHANRQGSRGGALTMHYTVLDPEIADLVVLRNVQTIEQKRIKDIDYSFGYNEEFAKAAAKNSEWMLVSYAHAPELHEAMYNPDQSVFVEAYNKVLKDTSIPKQLVNARDLALSALRESEETGRQYFHRTDEMNRHTPFKDTIYSSNLCAEIGLPTKGYSSVADLYKEEAGDSEIGLCSLAAINADIPKNIYEDVAYYALLMVDNVISLMEYPFPQLGVTAKARRSVGIGITNLAYAMAARGMKYSEQKGKQYIHKLAERHSYYLHRASLRLAKERGVCDWIGKTKYPDGWLPIDSRNIIVSSTLDQPLLMDWEQLRKDIVEMGGIRNSVLEAHMPCESSSLASGHTNSLYPVRELLIVKTSGTNKNLFIAPQAELLKDYYELAYDIPHRHMAEVYSIVQGFTGQGISADFYRKFPPGADRKVGTKELLTEFLTLTKLGVKTKYYQNSSTGVDEPSEESDSCIACKL